MIIPNTFKVVAIFDRADGLQEEVPVLYFQQYKDTNGNSFIEGMVNDGNTSMPHGVIRLCSIRQFEKMNHVMFNDYKKTSY